MPSTKVSPAEQAIAEVTAQSGPPSDRVRMAVAKAAQRVGDRAVSWWVIQIREMQRLETSGELDSRLSDGDALSDGVRRISKE